MSGTLVRFRQIAYFRGVVNRPVSDSRERQGQGQGWGGCRLWGGWSVPVLARH